MTLNGHCRLISDNDIVFNLLYAQGVAFLNYVFYNKVLSAINTYVYSVFKMYGCYIQNVNSQLICMYTTVLF